MQAMDDDGTSDAREDASSDLCLLSKQIGCGIRLAVVKKCLGNDRKLGNTATLAQNTASATFAA